MESMKASQERSREKQEQNPKPKKQIKKFSEKGRKQDTEVRVTKNRLREVAADGQSFVSCGGCGGFFKNLDCSHKISLSKSAQLASAPENIRLLCRQCHLRWESLNANERIELKCFVQDMRFLFDFDQAGFVVRFNRMLDEYNARPTPKLERVLGKLEKFYSQ